MSAGGSALAGIIGLIVFVGLFAAVLVYALWPGNRSKFRRAARQPLEEEERRREDPAHDKRHQDP